MTKEDKQIIDRAVKEEWRIGDRTRLKRLLEKNLKLYRENVELENKIADIKANCDLAIEGKDVRIMELEQKLEQTEKDLADYQFNYPKIKELEQEIVNLNSTLDLRKMQLDDSAEIIKEMQSNVDTLQKNNAELKEKLNFSTQYYRGEKAKDQLTKAKEIIKDLLRLPYANDWEVYGDVTSHLDKAEQFLKEIEK
jgi:chromosome segregation ATPase